ncbi:hypothetical protein DITRI_Ditri12bG0099900 [Diplodiscus trichospermus]
MELPLLSSKIVVTVLMVGLLALLLRLFEELILKPKRLRSMLRKQGISGPAPSILLGNIPEMKKIQSMQSKFCKEGEQVITHNCCSAMFPFLDHWRNQYGSSFTFSLGSTQILHITDPDLVKEITICTSLDLGKPSYQHKQNGPLLGKGILTSNGATWAHQRKILAPELYMEKVKGMMNSMAESSVTLVDSWNRKIESEGGVADIKIDDYIRSFSGDVISRACFGSNYSKGEEIFLKLGDLKDAMSSKFFSGIPGIRYLPIKANREVWRLEKEIRALVLKVVKERKEAKSEKDLLQMILESATNSDLGQAATDRFIVDNCKNIYLAGYETTAVSATWTLMLLASNPEWQDKARAEVVEICGGKLPDNDMLRKMKTLTMVINESLRLYPPVPVVSRELFQSMNFGDIHVPKGVIIWALVLTLHQHPDIWGPDADKFNPERFANGVASACKFPHVYIPFGVGPRICLGQNFAMAELKILLSLILSNFSFSLSPKYIHSPTMRFATEPEHGVNLQVKKLYN